MVGAVSVMGSSLVNGKACLDATIALSGSKNLRKQRKNRGLVIVGELLGQYEDSFEDVKEQILYYFTYKAVRTVLNQLYEMNLHSIGGSISKSSNLLPLLYLSYIPTYCLRLVLCLEAPIFMWICFVASNELGYGKHFIRNLGKEQHELAERVMVTRLHLYGRWIKKCDHTEMYERISDQNLELMRERLMETVIWLSVIDISNVRVLELWSEDIISNLSVLSYVTQLVPCSQLFVSVWRV
ncbi:UNVERIFIED_CONTAM: Chaperonin-like RbcX protein 2, chloroplastic [Sesamum calycinum]|uniref:Chaperonin-like RbcX protein 2, chloroplastic n=1 Tax=Sesamum calycinum TaxID=2727403 RepID=A0AAW2JIG7_9LAMI